jgi:hypothetical protein
MAVPQSTSGPMAVGMNLENIVDWSPAWTFTDAFQASRPWISHAFNTQTWATSWDPAVSPLLDLDANGNVRSLQSWTANGVPMRQFAGTLMFRDLGGGYPAGTYQAEWDGTGVVSFGFDAVVVASGRTAAGRHFATLQVSPTDAGIYMRIEDTSAADPVRNFHVWMPDFNGHTFHPLFLERLAPFGTLRFMGMQETNTSDIQTWADRRDSLDIRQGSGPEGTPSEPLVNGASLEVMVALANALDADPWFNMPHQADDTFVRNFATYVRQHLEPGRKVYVEWANEVWNFGFGFEASSWVANRAAAAGLDPNLGQWIVAGQEAKRDMDIWSEVFAGQTNHQLVRVAAGWAAVDWVTNEIATHMEGSFDAIAMAPYITPTDAQRASYSVSTTVDQVLADTRVNIATALEWVRNHHQLATNWSTTLGRPIQLLAYEGGAHLDGRNAPYQGAFHGASNDPRMGDIYTEYLRGLEASGLDLYVDFQFTGSSTPAPWGDFAKLHRMDEPLATAYRYNAVAAAANALPAFPGAEGFGAMATGGRGGQVIYVTTTAASGPGSLQWAIDQPGAKTILFKVSGLIDARIHLRNGDVTIAGHTSPGGITVRGFVTDETPFQDQLVSPPADFAENWILQHIRIRPGLNGPSDDGLRLRYTRNAIVDHVSIANATDEAVEISYSNNITIQNSMLAETLGGHSFYGGMLMNYSNPAHGFALDNLSIHHNIFNRIEGRLPEASRESLAAANSTINLELSSNLYWDPEFFIALGANTGQLTDPTGTPYPIHYRLNAVNNYFQANPAFPYGMWDDQILRETSAPLNALHVSGNRMNLYPTRSDYELFNCCNDYPLELNPDPTSRLAQNRTTRHPFPSITYTPALNLASVLPNRVGAWPRDPMDTRLLLPIRENRFDPASSSTNPYGDAYLTSYFGSAPTPPVDTDSDGMPDDWESTKGLNPGVADHNGIQLSTVGYTNLEVYLHELADRLTSSPILPVITLGVSPASVAEDGTANLTYTFTRTGSITSPLSVTYSVAGTASLGTDYTGIGGTPGTITFAAGSSTSTVTVDPTADVTVEGDETVSLTLDAGPGYTVGTTGGVVGTISNDDTSPPPPTTPPTTPSPTPSPTPPATPAALPRPTVITAVDLDGFSSSPSWEQVENAFDNTVSTKYLNSGGPNAGLQFSYEVPTQITTFVITTANDVPDRDPATYQIYGFQGGSWQLLTSGALQLPAARYTDSAAVVLPTLPSLTQFQVIFPTLKGSGTMMQIAELKLYGSQSSMPAPSPAPAPLPVITLGVSPASVAEDGAANLTYTFTRTGSTTSPLSVTYSVGGTAALGTDYTGIGGTPGTITFAAGSSTSTVTVDPMADTTVEADETVALTLVAGTSYTVGTSGGVVGTISNDDTSPPPPTTPPTTPSPTPSPTPPATPSALPRPTVITAVDLDGFSSSPSWEQVENAFDNTVSTKYLNSGGPNAGLQFSYEVPTQITTFVITTANDVPDRDPATYQIYGFQGGSWQLLTAGGLQLPAARYTDSAAVVLPTLPSLTQFQVIFPTLKGSGTMMQIAELKLYGSQSSTPAPSPAPAPLPVITLAVSPASVAEDGAANLTYTFTRTGSTTAPLSVAYSVGGTAALGTDYSGIASTPASKTITFGAGASTATVTVDPTADATVEGDETVAFNLESGTGYTVGTTGGVVGTISNDDTSPPPPPPPSPPSAPTALPQPTQITAVDLDGFSASPTWEQVGNAFDNTVGTKYLNSGGPNAGLQFSYGVPTQITSFVITTANDVPDRDPATYQIYGFQGGTWQLLTTGALQLPTARLTDSAAVVLPSLPALTQFRVIFPTLKGSGTMMQIAELKLFGSQSSSLATPLGGTALAAPDALAPAAAYQPIDTVGTTRLLRDPHDQLDAQVGSAPPAALLFNGAPVQITTLAGWQPLAAETVAGVNQVAWRLDDAMGALEVCSDPL